MIDDLIERLRRQAFHPTKQLQLQRLRDEAADRIEGLEAVLREIRDAPVGAMRTITVREVARRALEGER